jgi:hypothetical protein
MINKRKLAIFRVRSELLLMKLRAERAKAEALSKGSKNG